MAFARSRSVTPLDPVARCRAKFLAQFPGGFRDETYLDWERDYKVASHKLWALELDKEPYRALLDEHDHDDIVTEALRIEQRSRHPMLSTFEKIALRDAVRAPEARRAFAERLYGFLYGPGSRAERFDAWCEALAALPQRGKRVCTWPVATVFGFLARPREHLFVKPRTMRAAAAAYGFDLPYRARPDGETYQRFLDLAATVKRDLADLRPRDMIDVQSFLWVLGSDEYA